MEEDIDHLTEMYQLVVDALKTVYDPEIPVNIYELGLIYDVNVSGEDHVQVKMTLTAPSCPIADGIVAEVQDKIENIPGVKKADVELVFDPPWDIERASEAARLELGLL
jgi:FeS assembly SUF system protein